MSNDISTALDGLSINAGTQLIELPNYRCDWYVERWDEDATAWAMNRLGYQPTMDDFHALSVPSYELSHVPGNLLTTAGLTRLTAIMTAGSAPLISSTTARVGAGNGAGTAVVGDTDLGATAGAANRWFQTCTVTNPSAAVIQFVATFGTADGNFAWNEFGIDLGTATVTSAATVNATLLNHKTSIAQGTKVSGQTWTATATLTFS